MVLARRSVKSHTQAAARACARTRTCTRTHMHTHEHKHAHMRSHEHTQTCTHARTCTHTHEHACMHTTMHTHMQNMHTCTQTHTCTHTHAKTKSRSLSLSRNNGVRAWRELTPSLPPVPHPATLQGDPGVRGQVGMPRGPGLTTRSSQERGQGGPQGLYSAPSVELQSVTVGGGGGGLRAAWAAHPSLSPHKASCSFPVSAPCPPPPPLTGTWARQGLAGLPLGLRPLAVIPQALGWGLVAGSSPAPKASPTAPAAAGPGSPRTPAPSS